MVLTHLPSNVLLLLVPLMPDFGLAVAVLLLRFSISQMDVPTRQSYTVAVVSPDERSAASGVTGVARSIGSYHHDRRGDTFRGWLRTITRSRALDALRARSGEADGAGGSDGCAVPR